MLGAGSWRLVGDYNHAALSVHDALEQLRLDPALARHVTAWRTLEARPARYAEFPDGLDPRLLLYEYKQRSIDFQTNSILLFNTTICAGANHSSHTS